MPTHARAHCADLGCPRHQDCARYIAVPGPESTAAPVLPSLFPYGLPLGDPCPWFEARETNQ